jgi:hypothetical protein
MDIHVLDQPVSFDLYGLSGDVANFDFGGTGKRLMDEIWKRVKGNDLPHKGINFWVYDSATHMFTGVELKDASNVGDLLEHKPVDLARYVYYKHIGPYEKLGDVHQGLEAEMANSGIQEIGPRVEKYGHWTEDVNQLVTEIFIGVK